MDRFSALHFSDFKMQQMVFGFDSANRHLRSCLYAVYLVLWKTKGGTFCGCFYTEGGSKRTDWVTKHIFVPKGAFTPPFETAASLRTRLSQMYAEVDFKTIRAEGIFVCRK